MKKWLCRALFPAGMTAGAGWPEKQIIYFKIYLYFYESRCFRGVGGEACYVCFEQASSRRHLERIFVVRCGGLPALHVPAVAEGVPDGAPGNRLRKGGPARNDVVIPGAAAAREALPLFFFYGNGTAFPAAGR